MKFKDASTSDLIKMSENVHNEITKDVLDAFGVDLSSKELVHHDRTKPVWTQKIRNNKSLKKELDSFLEMVGNNISCLPEMMLFEKEHPGAISGNYSHDSISYDLEFLWICESHLDKFQKENYLTKKEIENYRKKISGIRDKIREIATRANLS
ncbi:MAG: hypothetical protein KGH76_04170 [Thaumarchaeota archaeon]|nr:hypothetical protein [Nitrososphaerota archaeon]